MALAGREWTNQCRTVNDHCRLLPSNHVPTCANGHHQKQGQDGGDQYN